MILEIYAAVSLLLLVGLGIANPHESGMGWSWLVALFWPGALAILSVAALLTAPYWIGQQIRKALP